MLIIASILGLFAIGSVFIVNKMSNDSNTAGMYAFISYKLDDIMLLFMIHFLQAKHIMKSTMQLPRTISK